MVENGLYVIKRDFLEIIKSLGGDCDVNNGDKRPVFCYPITEKYIDHPFISNNVHVVMKKQEDINEIKRKFRRVLSMESRRPNYFPQHITDIKKYLINELRNDNE